MGTKYAIDFDPLAFEKGKGKNFLSAGAGLGGDWICFRKNLPMDVYHKDYSFQLKIREQTRKEVYEEDV